MMKSRCRESTIIQSKHLDFAALHLDVAARHMKMQGKVFIHASRVEGADKILDYYRASKGAFLCIQKNKRILHYGYIIKQSL